MDSPSHAFENMMGTSAEIICDFSTDLSMGLYGDNIRNDNLRGSSRRTLGRQEID